MARQKGKKKINTVVQEAVKSLGTQYEVADMLGVYQSNISDYIRNSPKRRMSIKAAIQLSALTNLIYLPEDLQPEEDWSWLYEFVDLYHSYEER